MELQEQQPGGEVYPINQTFDVRLIDRFYMCSSYEIDITLCGDNEVIVFV